MAYRPPTKYIPLTQRPNTKEIELQIGNTFPPFIEEEYVNVTILQIRFHGNHMPNYFLPDEIGKFTHLHMLRVYHCPMLRPKNTGCLLQLAELRELELFDVTREQGYEITDELESLPSPLLLKRLSITYEGLQLKTRLGTGAEPEIDNGTSTGIELEFILERSKNIACPSIGQFTNLWLLILIPCMTIPEYFANFTKLYSLYIQANRTMTSQQLYPIKNLHALRLLTISCSSLHSLDNIPTHVEEFDANYGLFRNLTGIKQRYSNLAVIYLDANPVTSLRMNKRMFPKLFWIFLHETPLEYAIYKYEHKYEHKYKYEQTAVPLTHLAKELQIVKRMLSNFQSRDITLEISGIQDDSAVTEHFDPAEYKQLVLNWKFHGVPHKIPVTIAGHNKTKKIRRKTNKMSHRHNSSHKIIYVGG